MSFPQDVLKLGPSDFDNMPLVDLIMATPPCMPFSEVGGKGWSSRMAQPFIACVNLIKDLYDKQKGQLTYVFENVPTTTRFTAIMEALGPPIKVEAVMLGSTTKRTTTLCTNGAPMHVLLEDYQNKNRAGPTIQEFLAEHFGEWYKLYNNQEHFPKFMARGGNNPYSYQKDGHAPT